MSKPGVSTCILNMHIYNETQRTTLLGNMLMFKFNKNRESNNQIHMKKKTRKKQEAPGRHRSPEQQKL